MGRIESDSAEATLAFGRRMARALPRGAICLFYGDLGAGKTTLIKGLISERTGIDPDEVSSPTFTYVTHYEGVLHFDLYRLSSYEGFSLLGLEEELHSGEIACVEWPDRLGEIDFPAVRVEMRHRKDERREIVWEGFDLKMPAL